MSKKPTDNTDELSSVKEESANTSPSTAENEPSSVRNENYAVPREKEKNRNKKTKKASSESAKSESDDFIFAHYHKVKKHHKHSHFKTYGYSESHPHSDDSNDTFAIPKTKEERKKSATTTTDNSHDDETPVIVATYRKSKHSHSSHKSSSADTEPVFSHSEQHRNYKKEKRFKDKSLWKKLLFILGIVFGAILGLLLILAIVLVIMYFIGQAQLTDYSKMNMSAPENVGVTVEDSGRRVTYKGKEYVFDENITSILCMGIDKKEGGLGLDNDIVGTGGQADAIYLIAFNTKTGESDVIAISRDTMADIGIYSPEGDYLKTEKGQICLAYAYGDGKETSCLNAQTAVERLFYNLPIQSYFSMDVEAIAYLNDAVGGVTVTMSDDSFVDTSGARHYKGETITLYGENARRYLIQRDITELSSSVDRMDRQINYLKAFTSKTISMTKSDLGVPVNLMNIVSNNSVTNLNAAKVTAFATTVVTNGVKEVNFEKLPGTITSDGTYAEYIVDETALYEMILDVYYNPAN